MNTLTIVLLALNGAVQAIALAEGFISNQHVRAILEEVRQAIQQAIAGLQPHQRQAQEASRDGKPAPTQAPTEDKAAKSK